ncbi:uncharacterized protein N7511_006364 [Penicillium nucicola]|uniref:uncharacterized protein n=1 Tax=Penicillium nucicola TaxID=1850975 RepID=UPI002544E832|nr:uncharacterized protein N7511_006364 [Penicillium nucicola]KAJ5757670.1 hypothetical protein N7511_006364 [Penicillium nucicola]
MASFASFGGSSPPPPPPAAAYTPATYGPISNPQIHGVTPTGSGADKTSWGVRFNQNQAPPLPPRPSSTNEQPYSHVQSQPQSQPPAVNTGFHYGYQPPAAHPSPPPYTPNLPSGVPPPPPKIPQHAPAQQSGRPERPPLLAQGSGPAAMTGSYVFRPASVINTNAPSTSASALGPGTPSDWEHLGPTPGDFDDAAWFPPRQTSPPHDVAPPPSSISGGMPNISAVNEHSQYTHPRTDTNETVPSFSSGVHGSGAGSSDSPISPCTTHGMQTPPPPTRVDSDNSVVSGDGRSESIDNVIDAWVRPLSPPSQPVQPAFQVPTSQLQVVSQFEQTIPAKEPDSTQNVVSSIAPPTEHVVPNSTAPVPHVQLPVTEAASKQPDPFEDLDPWSKSSLERYVAMLRKEAVADLDEERYKIFTAFMAKETKLREILYNIEHDEPESSPEPRRASSSVSRSPLPRVDEDGPAFETGLIPVSSEEIPPPLATAAAEECDDIDAEDVGSEYSAGGRPKVAKQARRGSQSQSKLPALSSGSELADKRLSTFSLSSDVQKQPLEPLHSNPPRPIYTPFQYTEGPQRGSDNLKFDRPAHEAYSDLRQASAVSGRVMSNVPTSTSHPRAFTPSSFQNDRDETFLGLIRHKSTAYSNSSGRSSAPPQTLPESVQKARQTVLLEELRTMVRTPKDKQSESSWHITTRDGLDKFPDDFTLIQRTIDRWEATAKVRRNELDQERIRRQEESEEHIDDLFNGKEIGYADINTLEEDFRQTEARAQLEEERHEVEDFTKHVFNPLDEGLKEAISALRKLYDSALSQLDRDQKANGSPVEESSASATMNLVNDIHNKLEIRFQKRLEIALDCERRRKKAERRPLVFMGDMASLRKLDGEFDQMEQRNMLEACKDRDDRANRLMDSFDDAILHGLGINQSLLDQVASKAAQLDLAALRASGLPDSEIEQILKSAAALAASLRADSEAILRSSGVADMALNDADYGVSVAEARYANSDPDIFRRLADEKKKEDDTLQKDLDSKLQSIQKGPVRIESTIERLLLDLKNAPPAAPASPIERHSASTTPIADVPVPPSLRPSTVVPASALTPKVVVQDTDEDSEHKERLRRALEEAKKRNASKGH